MGTSQVAQWLKKKSTCQCKERQDTWVLPLGWEDPLEKEMATHSSILAWEIQWAEEPDVLQSLGSQTVKQDWSTEHMY